MCNCALRFDITLKGVNFFFFNIRCLYLDFFPTGESKIFWSKHGNKGEDRVCFMNTPNFSFGWEIHDAINILYLLEPFFSPPLDQGQKVLEDHFTHMCV